MSGLRGSVSVVIPCFRCGTTLERALASVAAQTLPPSEVILVDDASDDDTSARIAELATRGWPFAVKTIRLPANVGPGEARNAGWAAADAGSEFIAFLDADDEWLPGKLERQVTWMQKHPEFAWSAHRCGWGGTVAELKSTISRFYGRRSWRGEPRSSGSAAGGKVRTCEGGKVRTDVGFMALTPDRLLWRNPVATPTVLVRRQIPVRFRAGWRACEDFMFWQDLLVAGLRGALLEATLVRLGRRPTTRGGLTGDLATMHAGELRALATLRAEGRVGALAAIGWRLWARVKFLRRRVMRLEGGKVGR